MFVWFSFRKIRFNLRLPVVLLDACNHRTATVCVCVARIMIQLLYELIIHISILGVKKLPIA